MPLPLPPNDPEAEKQRQLESTIAMLAVAVALASGLMAPYLFFFSPTSNAVAPTLICLLSLSALALLRMGYTRYVPHLMVFGVLVAAVIAVLAFGSIRAAGTMLFTAGVAGAGIFLDRRALLLTILFVFAALIGLMWAETQGLMTMSGTPVNFITLSTHMSILAVVGLMVHYSRSTSQKAHDQLLEALNAHRRAEQQRDHNFRHFARMFRASPTPVIAQSASSRVILDVNPAFERCFGYERAQVIGRIDAFLWADPKQREQHNQRLFEMRRVTEQPATGLRANGKPFPLLISSELSDDPDDKLIISNILDVSEKQRRDALLLSLAQGMGGETGAAFFEALVRHMAQALAADIVLVSERLEPNRMRSLAVWQDGATGPNFSYPIAGTPSELTLDHPTLLVKEGPLPSLFPGQATRPEAASQTCMGLALRDHDGTPIGLLKAFWYRPPSVHNEMQMLMSIFAGRATAELIRLKRDREILHLNQTLELRVKARAAELERLNTELDSFAYSVSHDLKSPLRAIDGFTRLLGEALGERLTSYENELFARMLAATRRMSVLIADMLALARVSQGTLERGPTSLSALAEQVLRDEQEKNPGSALRWCVEPDLVCWCDPRLAQIALENLLGNAVKYSRNRPAPLVELSRVPTGPSDPPTFCVRDNGVGFEMAYAGKLFQPFQRLHRPAEFEGTGIGLATVRRIVERHGGAVWAQSEEGQGACFMFHFGHPAWTDPPHQGSSATPSP